VLETIIWIDFFSFCFNFAFYFNLRRWTKEPRKDKAPSAPRVLGGITGGTARGPPRHTLLATSQNAI